MRSHPATQLPASTFSAAVASDQEKNGQPGNPIALATQTEEFRTLSNEHGLLYSTYAQKSHGVDLPTFLEATEKELSRDPRMQVTDKRLRIDLGDSAQPIGVVTFDIVALDGNVGPAVKNGSIAPHVPPNMGRQYIIMNPISDTVHIITCVAPSDMIHGCDQLLAQVKLDFGK